MEQAPPAGAAVDERASASQPGSDGHQVAYTDHAHAYDGHTSVFQGFRRAIVDALPLRKGDVVLDVGCGTGLCFSALQEKVGPSGRIVGIDASSEMISLAHRRVAEEGWDNVDLVNGSMSEVGVAVRADAALFCAVHDVMRSPGALRNVISHLKPGSWVSAGGGKWAAPWLVALNLQVVAVHSPYVRSFEGFSRPWSHLERLLSDVRVQELAFGTGYVATGRVTG